MKTIVPLLLAAQITQPLSIRFSKPPMVSSAVQVRPHDERWVAPQRETLRVNPWASHPKVEAGGRKVFLQRCATCHGNDGRGSTKAPDLTRVSVRSQTDGALFWKISGGNTYTGMPTFSFLPEPQRWQLVLHLRAIAQLPPRSP